MINKGFTLIETLVAVTILMLAVAGPLTIASKGLTAALVAKDQITAFYLVQDAVEYIRYKRDSNKLAGANWLTNITGVNLCSSDGTVACAIDSIQDTISSVTCGGGSVCTTRLNYSTANNYFSYSTGVPSIFTRTTTVKIIPDTGGNSDEAQVTVTVTWSDIASVTHRVSVNEFLFNW